jgi:hypothetical protein
VERGVEDGVGLEEEGVGARCSRKGKQTQMRKQVAAFFGAHSINSNWVRVTMVTSKVLGSRSGEGGGWQM